MKSPIQIIVADDHPLYRSGVVKSLEEAPDLQVIGEANNAEKAVSLVSKTNADIALLDISMPGNGIEAASKILDLDVKTKVIMLTVSEHDKDIMNALEVGALGYVLKGVGSDELISIIRSVHAGMSYVSPSLAARVLLAMKKPDNEKLTSDQLMATLTKREEEILQLVSNGLSNKEVGRELELQEKTVKHYMTNILQKLQVRNRVEAAVKAKEIWRKE